MDNQQPNEEKMLTKSILDEIESGTISSRRQLYKKVGRSKKLLQWLNDNEILIPVKWNKEMLDKEIGRLTDTRACSNWNLVRLAKKYYGSWNIALSNVNGTVNQHRYLHLSDSEMLETLYSFIRKFQRLPLREEFDGSTLERPYWESFVNRFHLKKWSNVFGLLNLSNITYYYDKKHGYGNVIPFNGDICLSRQEYLIAKYLVKNKIEYEKEFPYGNSNFIFDFYLPSFDVYIEYYGINTQDYKERIEEKRQFYDGRKVIEIFKHDNTVGKLASEVQRL